MIDATRLAPAATENKILGVVEVEMRIDVQNLSTREVPRLFSRGCTKYLLTARHE